MHNCGDKKTAIDIYELPQTLSNLLCITDYIITIVPFDDANEKGAEYRTIITTADDGK